MESTDLRRATFAGFELDLETRELWNAGRRIDLAPQPSKVLAILVSYAGRLVERSELRRRIWGDSWLDWETGLHQAVRRIRVVLGDSATEPRFIETVPRRGYRFIAEVETEKRSALPSGFRFVWGAALSALLLLCSLATAHGALSRGDSSSQILAGPVPGEESLRLVEEGRYLLSAGKVDSALDKLHQAAEGEPDWAEPWTMIAEAELIRPQPARVERARRALETALVREPESSRAWLLLARLRLWEEWDWTGARQALQRASQIDGQDPEVWQLLASLETVTGRSDEALMAARRAMELDPVSTALRVDLGWTLYYTGWTQEALAECRRSLELEPHNPSARQCALQSLLVLERKSEAASMIDNNASGEPAEILVAWASSQLEALESQATCSSSAASATPRILAGDISGALDALVAGAEEGTGWEVPFARVEPLLAAWREDPRFLQIEEALGFSG